jgi:hypothetical protein
MNMEGYSIDDGFINSNKFVVLMVQAVLTALLVLWANLNYWSIGNIFVLCIVLAIVNIYVLRFIVFEERYYSRMYIKLKDNEITTPSIFWGITSIRDTEDGAILKYTNAKSAILVRLERDTITGKESEFIETHYDSFSDFYNALNTKGLKFVQMSLMEQAGRDPRLHKLDDLVLKANNKNIAKIVEAQIGHIKKMTRATLFETDYFLIYVEGTVNAESLVSDAIDSIYKVLDGAFVGFSILSSNDIVEMMKEEFGVKYFDYASATLNVFKNSGVNVSGAVAISEIQFDDGSVIEVGEYERNRIDRLASLYFRETERINAGTIKKTLERKQYDGAGKTTVFTKKSTIEKSDKATRGDGND